MNFLVVTHVLHRNNNGLIGGYAPYVREMNLWFRHVDSVRVIAPIEKREFGAIDLAYDHPSLRFIAAPSFNVVHWRNTLRAIFHMPVVIFRIFTGMLWAEHIHIRCPGNMGLLACFLQILFPFKRKTAKYAGNWDPSANQPLSYRMQRWLLNNPWLTRNMHVLVYGSWPDASGNIKPFFTASYSESEIEPLPARAMGKGIRMLFLGTLSAGKRPMLAARVAKILHDQGLRIQLDFFGEGSERDALEKFVFDNSLSGIIRLNGNVSSADVKGALKASHFLVFPSQSEGWPKAVAEAMFWGCVPVTTRVSCIPYMLGEGARGILIDPDELCISSAIRNCLDNPGKWQDMSSSAATWSRKFTLDYFEQSIGQILRSGN